MNIIITSLALLKLQEESSVPKSGEPFAEFFTQVKKDFEVRKISTKVWLTFQLLCSLIVFGFSIGLVFEQLSVDKSGKGGHTVLSSENENENVNENVNENSSEDVVEDNDFNFNF
jgi:hypothetical protein